MKLPREDGDALLFGKGQKSEIRGKSEEGKQRERVIQVDRCCVRLPRGPATEIGDASLFWKGRGKREENK